ncbi:MAG: nucleotidyltransferase family protein [Clostridia bacterium]|nr:nucleotidyltransferase family protein [Clostridia bacterium]
MDALILAGSVNNDKLRECSPVANEAFIPIGGKAMVQYVVEAIKKSSQIERIIIVGPPEQFQPLFAQDEKILFAMRGETIIQGTLNGLKLTSSSQVLIATSDIPLLTPEAVDMFIKDCLEHQNVELFYPIVPKEVNDRDFPGVKRTYVKLKDGIFTGGNLFLVNPEIVPRCAAKAEEIVSLRKSPLALAKLIGVGFIIKFLLRQLTIAEAENQVSKLLGVVGKAIVSPYPEIGVDVDKPSDLELVRKVLSKTE